MRPISELELESVLARWQTQHGLRLAAAEMPVLSIAMGCFSTSGERVVSMSKWW
jgi:hypothetical protein